MIHQPWVTDQEWHKRDSKLLQLAEQKVVLEHTSALVKSIPLSPPGIVFVRGPRQCGKSTLLRQYVQHAFAHGMPVGSIALLESEACESRHDLLSEIRSFCESSPDFHLLLIDEITSVEKWWLALKFAADSGALRNTLVLCTGSSADDVRSKADLLPGRRGKRFPLDFELLPVSYTELSSRLSLKEYFLTGGLPWAVNEFLEHRIIPPYVFELYGAWILGAMVRNGHTTTHLAPLLNYLTQRVCTPTSVSSLARDCGFGSNSTAEAQLGVLERNYALLPSRWSEPGSRIPAPRKNRKFYPADPILFHVFANFGRSWDSAYGASLNRCEDPVIASRLAETVVADALRRRPDMYPLHYFLGRKGIDFVGEEAIEVRFQNRVDIREFQWAEKMVPSTMGITVLTKTTRSEMGRIRCIPLEEWLTRSP